MRPLLLGFSIVAMATPAFATLGGDAASVDADRVHVQGAVTNIARTDRYTMDELQSATGTTIREYVSSAGRVFAVSWHGPFVPDLRQMLGEYFSRHQTEAARVRRNRRSRRPLVIDTGDLVVVVSGHTRSFSGRAVATQLMPAGVDKAAIK